MLRARQAGGESVALKLLLEPLDSEARLRFDREGRVLRELAHPHLVRVLDHGTTQAGHPWLALELLMGGSLEQRVRRTGPLDPRQTIDLGLALAGALGVVHAAGLIHRDLKPANVLWGADGRPRLTDFGLCRGYLSDATRVTASGVIMGTPAFMAPEQVRTEELGPPADVYALGATLYFALTGRYPFVGATAVAVMSEVLFQAPEPPSRLRPGVPPRLEALLLRCLAKDARQRPIHAQALLAELEQLDAAPRRSSPPLKVVGLGALAALAFALGAALVLGTGPVAPPPPPPTAPPPIAAAAPAPVATLAAPAPVASAAPEPPRETNAARKQRFKAARRTILEKSRRGDHTAALSEAQALLTSVGGGRRAEALLLRGEVREAAGDVAGALADVTEALGLEPDADWFREAELTRARRAARCTSARDLTSDGERLLEMLRDGEAAARRFREALELEPRLARAHQGLGVALQRGGRSVAAIDAFDRAAALAPESGEIRFFRAQSRLQRGEVALARADLETAGRLAGSSPAPWIALARYQLAQLDAAALPAGTPAELTRRGALRSSAGDQAGAREDLERAAALAPDDPEVRLELGQARIRAGDHAGALAAFERATLLEPRSARAHALVGVAHLAQGARDPAWYACERALALDPSQVDALLTRAALKELQGDVLGALVDLDLAVELRPDIHGLWARAAHHARAGREAEWRRDSEQMARLEPATPAEWVDRGLARGGLDDLAGGLADLDVAVMLAPEAPRFWYMRGVLFERSGDLARARRDYQEALRLAPDGPLAEDARRSLARVGAD